MPRGIDRSGDPRNNLTREAIVSRLVSGSPAGPVQGSWRTRAWVPANDPPKQSTVRRYPVEPYNWESRGQS